MAYLSKVGEEEEEQPVAMARPGAPMPMGGGAPASGPVAQQGSAQAPATSRFVPFARFLAANRDTAQRGVENIVQPLEQKAEGVKADLGKAQAAFQGPVQYVAGAYSGPGQMSETSGWGDLTKRAADVEDAAKVAGTPSGRGALLQQQESGVYGSGLRRLDEALLGNVGAERFASLGQKYGGLGKQLEEANAASAQAVGERRAGDEGRAVQAQAAEDAKIAARAAELLRSLPQTAASRLGDSVDAQLRDAALKQKLEEEFGPGAWERYQAAKANNSNGLSAVMNSGVAGRR